LVYAGKVAYKYKGTMPSNTSIELAEGTLGIAGYAFESCSSLTSVTIGNSVTSIGDYAFYGCSSLTSVTIPNSVTSIGNYAFTGCSSLTSVTIPNSVTSIGWDAFACSSLTSVHISDIAAWCNIKFAIYTSNPLYCAGHLYMNGKEITELQIPDGVTSIGYLAFNGCRSLTSVTIPDGVTSIGDHAFEYCSSLTSVKVLAETPPGAYITTFDNYDIELCVPEQSLEIYKATSPWSSFVNIIALAPPSTTSLTIGSTGGTTFSSTYNLDFSNVNGIKAYTATGYNSDNGEVTLVRIKEAKAGTGLYVSGNAGTYTIPTISSTAYNSLNMFVGVNEETTISTTDGSYTNYIYTKPTGNEAGFYKVTSDRAIPAGKAYLQIPTAWLNEETASEAKAVKLVFDDGESTGIDDVNRVESKEDVIYDLQGRRVKNPSKGIYIINGRKVVR